MSETQTLKPLQVLNASAGSGKTYHLVQAYIALLISDGTNPSNFKHIIAMTFTNKAALEMKERIVEALDAIGSENLSREVLKESLALELKLAPEEVVKRCQTVLEAILHQYEDFHVMTIDKFNLRLIKSFSRDLDLPGEFEVVLDESELIEQVVDQLLNQLGDAQHETLNQLMLEYAKNNIDEGNSWNFRKKLIEFGSILKQERHQVAVRKLLEMPLGLEVHRSLKATLKVIDQHFAAINQRLWPLIETLDPKQLPGGGHTINDLKSLAKQTAFPVQEQLLGVRISGNLEKSEKGKEIPQEIQAIVHELDAFWQTEIHEYAVTDLFLKNFFNMALLQFMARALDSSKKEGQVIRISEFNQLISALIQEENAPFIYERLGTRYHHYLLDEFQDTSHLQWLNLVPLLHESISQNYDNLIVGDPKQSIYRFKNGLAEQFVALPNIYNPDHLPKIAATSAYFEQMGRVSELSENWRSSPSIVSFNNDFFEAFRDKLPDATRSFYNAIRQTPRGTTNGLISIESREEKDANDAIVPVIVSWIESCIQDGFNPSDICILGRRNRECNEWAVALDAAGYRVVSSDSLLIDTSLEVQLSITFLKWRLKPTGENEKKQFAEMYLRVHHSDYNAYKKYLREAESASGRTYRYFDDHAFLVDYFGSEEAFFFKYETIYDLLEGFYRLCKLEELENPYLHHLADLAHEFGLNRGPNLSLFLEDYERRKRSIAVQIPAAKDAINIMTIHKSKGLEFPVVLLPSLNVKLDLKSEFLIPINDVMLYKKPAKKEVLQPLIDLYQYEMDQILTDSVNMCYVAMTRPVERLYIRNVFEKGTLGALFHEVLEKTGMANEEDGTLSVLINDGARSQTKQKQHAAILTPKTVGDLLWFPDIAFQDTEALYNSEFLSDEMHFGRSFHLLVSRLERKEDIQTQIQAAVDSGEITDSETAVLSKSLILLFENEEYVGLFQDSIQILNEQEILVDAAHFIRLDKLILYKDRTVLLDFKTGLPGSKDVNQVEKYVRILNQMEYPNVSAYLYYSALNELRPVL